VITISWYWPNNKKCFFLYIKIPSVDISQNISINIQIRLDNFDFTEVVFLHSRKNTNFTLLGIENLIYYANLTPAAELSTSWDDSNAKSYLESMNPAVHLLGEPSQILSNTVITPFSRWESTQVRNR
jgi:hypothetical protein